MWQHGVPVIEYKSGTDTFLYTIRKLIRRKYILSVVRWHDDMFGSCDYISFPKIMRSSAYILKSIQYVTFKFGDFQKASRTSLWEPSISVNSIGSGNHEVVNDSSCHRNKIHIPSVVPEGMSKKGKITMIGVVEQVT